jgi:3-carboxy-cis,cis-muconate cycloisomerase
MDQQHERGLGNWQAELAEWPALFLSAHGALCALNEAFAGLQVDPARMLHNIDALGGLVFAEAACRSGWRRHRTARGPTGAAGRPEQGAPPADATSRGAARRRRADPAAAPRRSTAALAPCSIRPPPPACAPPGARSCKAAPGHRRWTPPTLPWKDIA